MRIDHLQRATDHGFSSRKHFQSLFVIAFICASVTQLSYSQITIGENTNIEFASIDQARQILTAQDEFVRHMSPFDRAARMKTNREISEEVYLEFVGKNVLPWEDSEKHKITSALQGIKAQLEAMSLPFPKTVFIIKTTGREEGGAAYTRANAIVLPKGDLGQPISKIQREVCHELFHILSRKNPDLRDKLYAEIGFLKCNEVAFPTELKPRKITNPDAPQNDHCILLTVDRKQVWAIPILFSSTKKYNVRRGGEFFNGSIYLSKGQQSPLNQTMA